MERGAINRVENIEDVGRRGDNWPWRSGEREEGVLDRIYRMSRILGFIDIDRVENVDNVEGVASYPFHLSHLS